MLVTVHVATLAVMRACSFQLSEVMRLNRDFLVGEQSVINANLVKICRKVIEQSREQVWFDP